MLTAVGTADGSPAGSALSGRCRYAQYGSSEVVIDRVVQ